jgi:choline dehydrogenase-like flavoprotein
VVSVVRNVPLMAQGAIDYFGAGNGLPRKLQELTLDCMCEQMPDADSRMSLSDRRDRFGMRLPKVDWRSHPDEARTMHRMAELVATEFARIGFPEPVLAEWVRDKAPIPASFVDVAHPTGATRMSSNPAHGVVNVDCQVHGVEGLYVSGSSVFPTAGHCNPTQMIVAMAIRLADHLKERQHRPFLTEVMAHAG